MADRRPPFPNSGIALLTLLCGLVASAIGFVVWLVEVPVYLIRHRTLKGFKDADDWQQGFGTYAPEMRDQYARVLGLLGPWPDPVDPKFQSGGIYHNLKGCWCVWTGLSRERSGKLLGFVIVLAVVGWLT